MTPEQVSALSDVELNLEMLNIHMDYWQTDKDILKAVQSGKFNYLEDYNLTMPLAVENSLLIGPMNDSLYPDCWTARNNKAIGVSIHNKNPLRAICEVLVLIKCQS